MVTVAPLPRVAITFPPGFSRMNAPPPSAARIWAMMGVGSAVIVDVDVSVGGNVDCAVGRGVREGDAVGTPTNTVGAAGLVAEFVARVDGGGVGVEVRWVSGAGRGVERPVCSFIH